MPSRLCFSAKAIADLQASARAASLSHTRCVICWAAHTKLYTAMQFGPQLDKCPLGHGGRCAVSARYKDLRKSMDLATATSMIQQEFPMVVDVSVLSNAVQVQEPCHMQQTAYECGCPSLRSSRFKCFSAKAMADLQESVRASQSCCTVCWAARTTVCEAMQLDPQSATAIIQWESPMPVDASFLPNAVQVQEPFEYTSTVSEAEMYNVVLSGHSHIQVSENTSVTGTGTWELYTLVEGHLSTTEAPGRSM